ncbi:MAG: AMP-binding protein, partial [Anaerolineae bacterium]|nr:AMP-binding protein [Anaerolineae bacterium]
MLGADAAQDPEAALDAAIGAAKTEVPDTNWRERENIIEEVALLARRTNFHETVQDRTHEESRVRQIIEEIEDMVRRGRYRADELDFYLGDLGAKALVLADGDDGPAADVARRHGAGVLRVSVPAGAAAGVFTLEPEAVADGPGSGAPGPAEPGDTALVLHTSGTTSRPKIVPLSQANLAASARHIITAVALTSEDRCLSIMPLFHIHGLMAATLAALGAGGSLFAPGPFNALRFFAWLEEARPSWYTAVPTMHQAILARAARNPEALARARLRLIRSSSASLPPAVLRELEGAFRCPVIESYGMTEAAHQMTSNPLPPGERRPGSVGLAAGPLVRIMDAVSYTHL